MILRGTFINGVIVPNQPLPFTEGQEVDLTPRGTTKPTSRKVLSKTKSKVQPRNKKLWGAGLWADRDDITDSAKFARELRESSARGSSAPAPARQRRSGS